MHPTLKARTKTLAGVDVNYGVGFFTSFKEKVIGQIDFKRGHLLRAIDKKKKKMQAQKAQFNKLAGVKSVIVGAGPVGLRTAIEMALLEADITVLEMRTQFTRHNILHLWDWVCTDLLDLGCPGSEILGKSFFHVGTRNLQLLLTKLLLVMGVKFYSGVKFIATVRLEGRVSLTACF